MPLAVRAVAPANGDCSGVEAMIRDLTRPSVAGLSRVIGRGSEVKIILRVAPAIQPVRTVHPAGARVKCQQTSGGPRLQTELGQAVRYTVPFSP